MSLQNGIYEQVINQLLSIEIHEAKDRKIIDMKKMDPEESSQILASYFQEVVRRALSYVPSNKERLQKQIDICNQLIHSLEQMLPAEDLDEYVIQPDNQLLWEVKEKVDHGLPHIHSAPSVRPLTSISQSSLFTGSLHEPSLVSEFKKEIQTSDQIDILVSFVKWSGIRLILDDLREFTNDKKLRVITTSYMGATDYKAIEELSKLPNTEIKVSYDTKRTRLHAKAYIFHRRSGFTTAYIGSSNLSNAAVSSGLEWNVKATEKDSKGVVNKCKGTFETYWNDKEFMYFTPDNGQQLKQALIAERRGDYGHEDSFTFEVEPYAFQKEILEELEAERKIHQK